MNIRTDVSIEAQEVCQRVACAICERIGVEEYPDASSWDDETGNDLKYAQLAPTGAWVCSRTCLSQLMYQSSTAHGKSILNRYEFALRELSDLHDEVKGILEPWECDSTLSSSDIENARVALGHTEQRFRRSVQPLPTWIEQNENPVDILTAAIKDAMLRLEWRIVAPAASEIGFLSRVIGSMPDVSLESTSPILVRDIVQIGASAANLIYDLTDAITEVE
jgi:hypothetical protein